jgi:hypothetical protein
MWQCKQNFHRTFWPNNRSWPCAQDGRGGIARDILQDNSL